MAEAPHDFAEDDAEHFRRRLVIARKPAATRARIDAGEVREMGIGFVRPSHSREIAKANWCLRCRALDNSVQHCWNLPVVFSYARNAPLYGSVHRNNPHSLHN